MSKRVVAHTNFKHDCTQQSNWCLDEDPDCQLIPSTTPFFFEGDEYELPDLIADYFIAAGWCAEPGQDVVKPDRTLPVFVRPHNNQMNSKSGK